MNIWYLHHYATPNEMPGLHRPFEFGRFFGQAGHTTTVFSSSYLHYADENLITGDEAYIVKNYADAICVFVKTCGYQNSGYKRVINMFQFGVKLPAIAKRYAKENGKPDVIIASSPHPFTMLAGLKIAKQFGVPCICEVRDFWPEVFFYSGKLKETSLVGKILLAGERYIYTKADGITFLKEGDHTYITDHKWDIEQGGKIDMQKCIYINNGVDLCMFDQRIKEYPNNDPDFEEGKFTVLYCGTIRPVNNVDLVLNTAKILGSDYKFLIYGTGNCVDALQKRIHNEQIDNVVLKGFVNNKLVPAILQRASLNLLNYSGTAYNWSRGNSSNKLFEYLASEKPVLSTVKMGYDILERFDCGFSVKHTTPEEIAHAIQTIKNMTCEEYTQMCKNARRAAEEFNIPTLSEKYLSEIDRILRRYNMRKKEKRT